MGISKGMMQIKVKRTELVGAFALPVPSFDLMRMRTLLGGVPLPPFPRQLQPFPRFKT